MIFTIGPLGVIQKPPIASFKTLSEQGVGAFIGRLIGLALIFGGLYILVNIIMAGYLYVQGGSQNMTKAWDKIWQSLLGMIVMAAAVLITGIISWFVFDSPTFLLAPTIKGPQP